MVPLTLWLGAKLDGQRPPSCYIDFVGRSPFDSKSNGQSDESTCFHLFSAQVQDLVQCRGRKPCGKALHPSEDGEALQKSQTVEVLDACAMIAPCSPSLSASRSWFAVYTASRHEKKVAQHFAQRSIEHFLALYRAERRWRDGSRITLDLPLFPGYIFVHITRMDRSGVLSVPGTVAMVDGTGGVPAQIPEGAIEALRAGLRERDVEPHQLLTVGQHARIRAGSFAGMEGVVVRRRNGLRVVLTLKQIMQSIAVEVSEADLEPITPMTDGLVQATSQPTNVWECRA